MSQSDWQLEYKDGLMREFRKSEIFAKILRFYKDNNIVFSKEELDFIVSHISDLWKSYSQDKRLGYTNTVWSALRPYFENYPELFTLYENVKHPSAHKYLFFIESQWENNADIVFNQFFNNYHKCAVKLNSKIELCIYNASEIFQIKTVQYPIEFQKYIFGELQEKQGLPICLIELFIDDDRNGHLKVLGNIQLFNEHRRHSNSFIRKDLNQLFRSSWEANIARFFNYCEISWEYEPNSLFTGDVFYKPDFLCSKSVVVEVKGYWDSQSLKKVNEFHNRFPQYKIGFIDKDLYKEINYNYGNIIKNWEYEQVSIENQAVPIVGLSFVKDKTVFSEISIGEEVVLVREPQNTYDKNAIAVYSFNKKLLGHIAAEWALIYAQKIDLGMVFCATISKIEFKSIILKIKKVSISHDTVDNFIKYFKGC